MKMTDTTIAFALEEGKKVRRQVWWTAGKDDYIKADKNGMVISSDGLVYGFTVDDIWAFDWEVV